MKQLLDVPSKQRYKVKGNWKLVKNMEGPAWELFDPETDPTESKNLAFKLHNG